MRGCNLLSNLSVLAPNAASDGVQGAGGLRSAPRRGAARLHGLETAVGSPGMVCRRRAAMERPGAGRPSPWLGPAPEASPASVDGHCGEGAARGSGEAPRLHHPHKNDRHSRPLRSPPDLAGTGRACLRRRPGYLGQPPRAPDDLIPGSSSSRRQRHGCSASNEGGLAGGCQPPGSLANLSSSSPGSALQRRTGPCAHDPQAAVDSLRSTSWSGRVA